MTMRNLMLPGALMVLGVLACLDAPQAIQAQQAGSLKEKLEIGTVRIVVGQRAMNLTLTYNADTNYASSTSSSTEKSFRCEEWVTAMDSGRVGEVVRSYRDLVSSNTSGEGDMKITIPGSDWKNNQTFVLRVKSDGSREITHETYDYISADDRAYVQLDTDADLLPGRDAKVGESWKVSKEKLGRIGLTTHLDTIETSDITVKFESVAAADNGDKIARLAVSGSFRVKTFYNSGYGAEPETDFASDATISGFAQFNVTRGQMAHYEWKGDASGKGRLNGGQVKASATFAETNDYGYVTVLDNKADNGKEGPDSVTDIQTFKHGAVEPGHVLIGRNDGKTTRIQVLDTASRKIVRTVLAMPGRNTVSTLALSPDRKRVAFSSNLNSAISIADADVFVLELETGKINQVSPGWADNNGIAKALDTGKTTTVTGRIVWYDNDERYRCDRHDGFTGSAHIDHTACHVVVGSDGKFTLTGVPVGASILLQVSGRLPNYSNGKMREGLEAWAGMVTVSMVLEEGGKDLGDLRIHSNFVNSSYDRPSWQGDTLWVNESGWTRAYKAGYPKDSWQMVELGKTLDLLHGGFSVSPDGKLIAQCRSSSGGTGVVNVYDTSGKHHWACEVPGAVVDFKTEGVWTSEGNWACAAGIEQTMGKTAWGAPGLVIAQPAQKAAGLYRACPQLCGHTMVSVAVDQASSTGFFVTHKYLADKQMTYGDAWAWDATTDTLTRLTSLGDVICVASYGR
jgi:hypothetical protein